MRTLRYLLFLLLAFSCGKKTSDSTTEAVIATGKIDLIKAKRRATLEQYDALSAEIEQLNKAIAALNPDQQSVPVTSVQVRDTVFKHLIEIQGNVQTKQNLIIFSEHDGVLNQVYVKEGQAVKKGQLLAVIKDKGLIQMLIQARAQAHLAETTFQRQKRLWGQKIGSEIQYLKAKANAESSRQAVYQLQAKLAKTQIHAPFNGTIEQLLSDQGQVVVKGSEIMRIVNLKNMYVQAEIPENYIKNITKGNHVSINLPAIGKTYDGVIRQVGNFINPNNRSFSIQVDIPNPRGLVKPNLMAKLEITDYTNPKALVIPKNIIRKNASGQEVVYIIQKRTGNLGQAQQAIITTGFTTGHLTEVLSGLKSGQTLVASGAENLKNGDKVLIKHTR